jgi:hypothetical protein
MEFSWYSKYRLKYFHPKKYPVVNTKNGKLIFIHINKTAGTSILKAIGKKKLHLTSLETISLLGAEEFRSAFKFCVVRNPYDRLESSFKHGVMVGLNDYTLSNDGYNRWVDYSLNSLESLGKKKKFFIPQTDWITTEDGEFAIDRILKFERLNQDFQEMVKDLNLSFTLNHLNSSKKMGSFKLSSINSNLVKKVYQKDFEILNY